MRIATWNVNSIRQRLPHLLDYLKEVSPDALVETLGLLEAERFEIDTPGNCKSSPPAARPPTGATFCTSDTPGASATKRAVSAHRWSLHRSIIR